MPKKTKITAMEQLLKHALLLPRSNGQRLELAEGTSPRGLTGKFPRKADNINSAPLYISRFVLQMPQKRGGAAGLGELQLARGQNTYFSTAPAQTQSALHCAHSREVVIVKALDSPVRDTRARATVLPVSRVKLPRGVSNLSLPPPSAFFSLLCSSPPGC
jgi:hypothetical protein